MALTISMFQVKIGIRNMVIPGARRQRMVVVRFTAVSTVETPVTMRATSHRSAPAPGEWAASERGRYPVHPKLAAPREVRKPDNMVRPPPTNSQYDRAFRRGKAMSGAPMCSGTR